MRIVPLAPEGRHHLPVQREVDGGGDDAVRGLGLRQHDEAAREGLPAVVIHQVLLLVRQGEGLFTLQAADRSVRAPLLMVLHPLDIRLRAKI